MYLDVELIDWDFFVVWIVFICFGFFFKCKMELFELGINDENKFLDIKKIINWI